MPTITVPDIIAVGAVRQCRADTWKPRPRVLRYRAFKDELRLKLPRDFVMPESGYHLTFYLPIPKTWSKKKKAQMEGQPHQSRPDKDNLEKSFLDAVLAEDSRVWDGRVTKRWSVNPRVEIEITEAPLRVTREVA